MPEAGLIPLPRKLAAQGVTDMSRLSDRRMSGTAGGTIVLHISAESAVPSSVLGVVRDGDVVTCNVKNRVLRLEIPNEEIKARVEERKRLLERGKEVEGGKGEQVVWVERKARRGYRGLYERCVNQAEEGADFDFLTAVGPRGGVGVVTRHS